MAKKRIMVDMSACLIHHGHIRLLEKAAKLGSVVVGLASDEEIVKYKGLKPELSFAERREVLEAVKYVDEVVETPWLITEEVLDKYKIDLLFHGNDNSNPIPRERLEIAPRTKSVSSSELRERAMGNVMRHRNNERRMLTPGPAHILAEAVENLRPVFGRGDDYYDALYQRVTAQILKIAGQDKIACLQGSATLAIEIVLENFISGKVLLVNTGYYSERIGQLLKSFSSPLPSGGDGGGNEQIASSLTPTLSRGERGNLDIVGWQELSGVSGKYDWVIAVPSETSMGLKLEAKMLGSLAKKLGAKLFFDATASIGLEEGHEIADVVAFSSCKGLCGLTGAAFVAFKSDLTPRGSESFYLDLNTHLERKITGPYHALCSLDGTLPKIEEIRQAMRVEKKKITDKYPELLMWKPENQPLLCTHLTSKVELPYKNAVLYTPRVLTSGMIICHLPVAL